MQTAETLLTVINDRKSEIEPLESRVQ